MQIYQEQSQKETLKVHEWLAIITLIGCISLITIATHSFKPKTQENISKPCHLTNPLIEITIEGAVEHPGTYQVKKGTCVKELLGQARPTPDANLSNVNEESLLRHRQVIKIQAKKNKKTKKMLCKKSNL